MVMFVLLILCSDDFLPRAPLTRWRCSTVYVRQRNYGNATLVKAASAPKYAPKLGTRHDLLSRAGTRPDRRRPRERYRREYVEMHCKPATVPHYRLMLRKQIVPALGECLVVDVEHKDILQGDRI